MQLTWQVGLHRTACNAGVRAREYPMKNKILSFLGIIIILIASAIGGMIGKGCGNALVQSNNSSPQEIEQELTRGFEIAARQINQNAPIMVDEYTRMDKATVGPGARVTYHCTFLKYASEDVDPTKLSTNLRPIVKDRVCNNKDMKPSLQYGGIYTYTYYGNDEKFISSFDIDRNDCGFPKKP